MSCQGNSTADLIIRGEDKTIIATVTLFGDRDISTATEVLAVIKDRSRSEATTNGPTISCVDSGEADWRSGKVAVPYTALETEGLATGNGYELELKITLGGAVRKGFSKQSINIADSVL
jgi:hypothetical protein